MTGPKLTLEPETRISYPGKCAAHNFDFVSMPTEIHGDDLGYAAKCPLKSCPQGLLLNGKRVNK